MSYESDRSDQPLPGDSDSLNHASQFGREEQSSWLLDGETAAPQPTGAAPFSQGESNHWLLDSNAPEEPSLVVTEDTEGDSWLMNVDDPTVTLDVDEVGTDHGFSASYCEPESTASVFGKLLVPAVFVAVLGVGGLLVWRSMSGLGLGPNDSGDGSVVLVPSSEPQGETLAGPSFDVSNRNHSGASATLRGSIQRDGSVKKSPSNLSASVAGGQFGFTPSTQAGSTLEPSETHAKAVAMAPVTPALQANEPSESAPPVPAGIDSEAALPEIEGTLADAIQADETGTYGAGFMTLILHATEWEARSEDAVELYEVQPSTSSMLSFGGFFPLAVSPQKLMDWGFSAQSEVAMASEDLQEPSLDDGAQNSGDALLSSEQEELLALVQGDDSLELAFVWTGEPSIEESTSAAVDPAAQTQEDSTDSEFTRDSEWSERFVDQLLAMGPVTGTEVAPEGEQGFEVNPLDAWLDGEVAIAQEGLEESDSPLASASETQDSGLPVSSGMDENGDWRLGDGYVAPEIEWVGAAIEGPTTGELEMTEVLEDTSELASVDFNQVKNSVGTDLEQGTTTSIEALPGGSSLQDPQDLEPTQDETPLTIDWIDPLAEMTTEPLAEALEIPSETPRTFEDLEANPMEAFPGIEELVAVEPETTDAVESDTGGMEYNAEEPTDEAFDFSAGDDLAFQLDPADSFFAEDGPLVSEESLPADTTMEVPTLDLLATPESEEMAAENIDGETIEQDLAVEEDDAGSVETVELWMDMDVPESTEVATGHSEGQTEATETETEVLATHGMPKLETPSAIQVAPANQEELLEVASDAPATTTESTEVAEVTETAPNGDEPEAAGERSLLDMYSDWNLAEDQGQLQPLSSSMWQNFSIGEGDALPFRVAQAAISTSDEASDSQPEKVVETVETVKAPMGILKRRKADNAHWQGKEVPMHAIGNATILLTPNVGPVRVIAKDGETIEGRLHGMGQNYVWLNTNLGRLSIPSRRVERVERIDPNQYSNEVKSVQDYTKLPKVRVRMKGGVFTGYELAREGNRITIRTEKGYKMTLVSDDIQPASSHKATDIKRRIE